MITIKRTKTHHIILIGIIASVFDSLFNIIRSFDLLKKHSFYSTITDRPSENLRWNPRRFSTNTTLNINRGMNIIHMFSAYQMSAWVYDGEKPPVSRNMFERRWVDEPKQKLISTKEDAKRMAPGDTLYVSHSKLQEWAQDFLPHIETDFVLINTPFPMGYPDWVESIAPNITNHKNMMGWFCHNIGNYTGGQQYHAKVHPFPIGLKGNMGVGGIKVETYRNPVPTYRKAFLKSFNGTIPKTRKVYAGFLSRTTDSREAVPSGRKLPYGEFLNELAKSKYVISPDGDHPDCHRNYEAIGLGAVPITELDPFLYRNLKEGPVVYRNTNWNVTWLEETLPEPNTVNRNLVFEEYWMEYIERAVGRPLQWWDKLKSQKIRLVDFAEGNSSY